MPAIPLHISAFFIALVFIIAFLLLISVHISSRKLNLGFDERRRNILVSIGVIFVWLMFTLLISKSGLLLDFSSMPPHLLLIGLPPLLLILFLILSKEFNQLTTQLDNYWIIYVQSFRVLMEFILWLLYHYHVIPVQMTFEGRNFDILIGISAPVVAYYCHHKKCSPKLLLLWNVAGLLLLGNIVAVAILSTPYSFRLFMNEPANTIVFNFPFVWLPAFVVPFAFLLHLISIRKVVKGE